MRHVAADLSEALRSKQLAGSVNGGRTLEAVLGGIPSLFGVSGAYHTERRILGELSDQEREMIG